MRCLLLTFVFVLAVFSLSTPFVAAEKKTLTNEAQFRAMFQKRLDHFVAQVGKVLPKALAVPVGEKLNVTVPKHNFENGDLLKEDEPETVEFSSDFFSRLLQQEVALRGDLPYLTNDLLLESKPCMWKDPEDKNKKSKPQPHHLMKTLLKYLTFPPDEWEKVFHRLNIEHSDGPSKTSEAYYQLLGGSQQSSFVSEANEYSADDVDPFEEEKHMQQSGQACAENLITIAVKICAPVEVTLEVLSPMLKSEDGTISQENKDRISAFTAVYAPKTLDPRNDWRKLMKQQSSCGLAKHLAVLYGAGTTTTWDRVEEVLETGLNAEVRLWTRESVPQFASDGESDGSQYEDVAPDGEFDPRKEYDSADAVANGGGPPAGSGGEDGVRNVEVDSANEELIEQGEARAASRDGDL